MAVTHLGNGSPGAHRDTDDTYPYEVPISLTISAGSNRLLFCSAHSKGNSTEADFQWVRIYTGYTDPTSRGTLVKTLTSVLDIEADAVLHAEYFVLKEADMPSNGSYTLVANANESGSGAFATAICWALFAGVDQTASPTTASNTDSGSSSISQSISPSGAGVICDNWSGDGSNAVKGPAGESRTSFMSQTTSSANLRARAAYVINSTGGSKTFTWSTNFHNRNALGILFYPEDAGGGKKPNTILMGSHF